MSIKQIENVSDVVEEILSKHPASRDSDSELYRIYLFNYANCFMNTPLDQYFAALDSGKLAAMDTLGRVRRKLQSEGKFLGKKQLIRLEEAEKYKEWAVL